MSIPSPLAPLAPLAPNAWKEVRSRLNRYVRRRVESASVDDVVGQILLRLVHHQETLRTADNPAAWMFRVAANIVADHHRRRAVERRALDGFAVEAGDCGGTADTLDAAVVAELAACLKPFIRALPPTQRDALMLTDLGGLSQPEAARRLGLSVSGLKSRVQRGRTGLKQALLRCCAIETDRWGTVLAYRSRNRPSTCSARAGCCLADQRRKPKVRMNEPGGRTSRTHESLSVTHGRTQ